MVCRWKGFFGYLHSTQGLQRVPSQAHPKGLKAASGLGAGAEEKHRESGGDLSFRFLSPPGTTVRPCKQNCLTSTPTPGRKPEGVPTRLGDGGVATWFSLLIPFPAGYLRVHGKATLPLSQNPDEFEGEGQERGPRGVPVAAFSAGRPHRPDSTQAGERGVRSHPKPALLWRLPPEVALPLLPRGSRARGERGPLGPRSEASLRVLPDGSWTGPGRPGPLAPGLRSPLRPVPAAPSCSGRLARLRARPRSLRLQRACPRPLSRAPAPPDAGPDLGRSLRAIGLGRCSDPALRISPGFVDRRESGQASDSPLTPPTTLASPGSPASVPGAQGFETVVTPQRKR